MILKAALSTAASVISASYNAALLFLPGFVVLFQSTQIAAERELVLVALCRGRLVLL